ncbi:hypothetical protein [Bifidobacterium samirii]|nr:hypothetical protein [Bifidobacterium samirii]
MIRVDAKALTALNERIARIATRANPTVTAVIKRGAQNIKTAVKKDLNTSSNQKFRNIPVSYEMRPSLLHIEADIAPRRGGNGNLAPIAFWGSYKGHPDHRFYEHGEDEFPNTCEHIRQAVRKDWL